MKQIKKDVSNKKLVKSITREKEVLCRLKDQKHAAQIHLAFQDVRALHRELWCDKIHVGRILLSWP